MTEVDGGTGEALPVATATKEESTPEKASPLGARWQGRVSYSAILRTGSQSRGGRIRRRIHKRVDGGDTDTPGHTVVNGRPVMVPEPDSNPEVNQELEDG